MNVEDAENGIHRRIKTLDLLIGNNKTTFTKVLRRNAEELGEGRKVWGGGDAVFLPFHYGLCGGAIFKGELCLINMIIVIILTIHSCRIL